MVKYVVEVSSFDDPVKNEVGICIEDMELVTRICPRNEHSTDGDSVIKVVTKQYQMVVYKKEIFTGRTHHR